MYIMRRRSVRHKSENKEKSEDAKESPIKYTNDFKADVLSFAALNGNRPAVKKFNIAESTIRLWRSAQGDPAHGEYIIYRIYIYTVSIKLLYLYIYVYIPARIFTSFGFFLIPKYGKVHS